MRNDLRIVRASFLVLVILVSLNLRVIPGHPAGEGSLTLPFLKLYFKPLQTFCSYKAPTGRCHGGIDWRLPDGTIIVAVLGGRVTRIVDNRPNTTPKYEYGNVIYVDHPSGLRTIYAHLKSGTMMVQLGRTVERGSPLGESDDSGYSTTPHLHFEVTEGGTSAQKGTPIDPFLASRYLWTTNPPSTAFPSEVAAVVNLYDDTENSWNFLTFDPVTGGPDSVIGAVGFRPPSPLDPNVVIAVYINGAAANCTLTVELVTAANDFRAGLPPDGNHFGIINVIGTLKTNPAGSASGSFVIDVRKLANVATVGQTTYAHIDLEDYSGTCMDPDGTQVNTNEYGASGKTPGSAFLATG